MTWGMSTDEPVRARLRRADAATTGELLLDRPKALNSINPEMSSIIAAKLEEWRGEVDQVVIASSSPRAFCAGGDVRRAREFVLAGDEPSAEAFFAEEYGVMITLESYPVPVVALADGVVMGGGFGLAAHSGSLVVTENTVAAMPETPIGFNTDVGMSYTLQRLDIDADEATRRALGRFLGLTGFRLNAAELLWSGLASHAAPAERLAGLKDEIAERGAEAALRDSAVPRDAAGEAPVGLGENRLAPALESIGEVFSPDTWAEIDARIEQLPSEAGPGRLGRDEVRGLLSEAAPSSLVATAELFAHTAHSASLSDAIAAEDRLAKHMRGQPDFAEGVRAVLVDKDHDASFQHASTAEVDPESYRRALAG